MEDRTSTEIGAEIKKTTIFVFSGGYAKRLGRNQPKALITVAGQPLMDRCIRFFGECGFRDFVFFLGHGYQEIVDFVSGKNYGLRASFVRDPVVGGGKGAALRHALDERVLDEGKRAIVTFPDDIFTDATLPVAILLRHLYGVRKHNALASIVITERIKWPYGVVEKDDDGFISKFEEKPIIPIATSVGLSVLEPSVYQLVRREVPLSASGIVELDRIYEPLAASRKLYTVPIPYESWYPVNTEKDLDEAESALAIKTSNLVPT